MRVRVKDVPIALALLQLADAAGNQLAPRRIVDAHLDHLQVPARLRPALPVIKILSSAGLVLGLKAPRVGAVTSAALVGYYAAAVGFPVHADDHPAVAVPAVLFGATAATTLLGVYLPAMAHAQTPDPDVQRYP